MPEPPSTPAPNSQLCPGCRYDLGLLFRNDNAVRCPECGRDVPRNECVSPEGSLLRSPMFVPLFVWLLCCGGCFLPAISFIPRRSSVATVLWLPVIALVLATIGGAIAARVEYRESWRRSLIGGFLSAFFWGIWFAGAMGFWGSLVR